MSSKNYKFSRKWFVDYFIHVSSSTGITKLIPDKLYLRIVYRGYMRRKLNLKNPKTYNEKLQWLKLYDHNPMYTTLVDKYTVKEIVGNIIGNEYIIPSIGVWNSFDEIDFDSLPDSFVLKCTHDSGGVIICKDKQYFDYEYSKAKLNSSLKRNYFWDGREWPYKNVKPRIIAEPYVEDSVSHDLKDYKFFCFNGIPKYMFIATDRQSDVEETKFDFYDMEFNHLDIKNGHPNSEKSISRPKKFELMKSLASKLSKGIPQVRVDFYETDGRIFFGEMTFFHWGGMVPFVPEKWDLIWGNEIFLPE